MKEFILHKPIAVVEHADSQLKLKLRNISSDMRKRVNCFIKDRTVRAYTSQIEGAVKVNGYSHLKEIDPRQPFPAEPIKGVSNYKITTNAHADRLKELNGDLRCSFELTEELAPMEVDRVYCLWVTPFNEDFYANVKIKHVDRISFDHTSQEKIDKILSQIDSVSFLYVVGSALRPDFLEKYKSMDKLTVHYCAFPKGLRLNKLTNFDLLGKIDSTDIKIKKLDFLSIDCASEQKDLNWIRSLKSLKRLKLASISFPVNPSCLPKSLRYLTIEKASVACNLDEILERCSYLIKFTDLKTEAAIKTLEKSKLKVANCIINDLPEEDTPIRLRQVSIGPNNVRLVNERPILLSKCTNLEVNSEEFDFSLIPESLKNIKLIRFNQESKNLSRFGGEFG